MVEVSDVKQIGKIRHISRINLGEIIGVTFVTGVAIAWFKVERLIALIVIVTVILGVGIVARENLIGEAVIWKLNYE